MPAVNPAKVSTTEEERPEPFWPVMKRGSSQRSPSGCAEERGKLKLR